MSQLFRFVPVLLLVGFSTGCGGGPVPVNGFITVDGQPVPGLTVMFHPEGNGRPSTAVTDEAGRFSLSSKEANDGAMPGKYKVSFLLPAVAPKVEEKPGNNPGGIAGAPPMGAPSPGSAAKPPPPVDVAANVRGMPGIARSDPNQVNPLVAKIPREYGQGSTTPLTVTVPSGTIEIAIKSGQ